MGENFGGTRWTLSFSVLSYLYDPSNPALESFSNHYGVERPPPPLFKSSPTFPPPVHSPTGDLPISKTGINSALGICYGWVGKGWVGKGGLKKLDYGLGGL